jgi:hypothetical protein
MLKLTTAALFSFIACSAMLWQPALAQCNLGGSPNTTLRDPLLYGAPSTSAFQSAPEGQPPPVGDGSMPAPINPGMEGPPTLIPSIPITPANDIMHPSYRVNFDPATEAPPGVVGPSTWVPPPPSTPGADPGIIRAPLDFYPPPARVVHINPGGGISGGASNQRWGGQTTADYGRYKHIGKRRFDFGEEAYGSTSEDGPDQLRPGASSTLDLYGRRIPIRNNGEPIIQTIAPY